MKHYSRWNILLGWLTFLIALITYLLTLEPTVSFWDCGEFISCSYKLEVGHPPGAPLFLMMGRIASLFASSPEKVALMINAMSGLASAFTILFLFWTITHLAAKILLHESRENLTAQILVLGSGLVGALAYTFSDTFWFSAVEGEVYATSSLFTAVVFWAILKWENVADEKHADRWLILIAYLMGLSIGVHLLNLLAIPAIVLVYYFKRYPNTTAIGVMKALAVSVILLAVIMYGIIQGLVIMAGKFELLFVNSLGMPFNSGVLIYLVLIVAGLIFGIWYSHRKRNVLWNAITTGVAVILIGYSSYAMIVIRSLANPPIDFSNPENVFSLLSYLNRESYGDRPLITGHNFDDELRRDATGYPVLGEGKASWQPDTSSGKYIVTYRKPILNYESSSRLFPRLYSQDPSHIRSYREWTGLKEGERSRFGHNLAFFFRYQVGHMYLRYFMWNFAGKQNDNQNNGSLVDGNWLSGIGFIDNARLGNQELLPDKYRDNPSRNKYYMLPLLLGIMGLLFHYSRHKKDFWVVMALFFFTGLAIVMYLNQTPLQPRERDYAFAGSFYAFAIWIGLGVAGVLDSLKKQRESARAAGIVTLVCLVAVPGLMAVENWDDHDRSGRYLARDIAKNYIATCDPQAFIFTNGDNDTYPLWYVQEVEGYRTDVRIVNTMLINSDWYIGQMASRSYDSDPLSFLLPQSAYREGLNNSFYMMEDPRFLRLETMMEGIRTRNSMFFQKTRRGDEVIVVPTNKLILPVDTARALNSGAISQKEVPFMTNPVAWQLSPDQYTKATLASLDMIAAAGWNRPVYFVSGGTEGSLGLENYFRQDGLAYRLTPVQSEYTDIFNLGRIDPDILYKKLVEEFTWGGLEDEDVYLDHNTIRTFSVIRFRKNYVRLAEALLEAGDTLRAVKALDHVSKLAPNSRIPYDFSVSGISYADENNKIVRQTGMVETYYRCGETEKGNALLLEYLRILEQDLRFYESLKPTHRKRYQRDYYESRGAYEELVKIAGDFGQRGILE